MDTVPRIATLDLSHADSLGARRDHLRAVIARLGGYCDWCVDSTGWVVTLYLPQERTFTGPTLEAALAACVDWLTPARRPVRPRVSAASTPRAVRDRA